ncbi:MAG: isoprenoid biosynthesis glyoxalase ElbB [Cytophagaceae bacterium]|nr:isoprenoid biosynthesis glyoxalase ElbB [Cytophagaceae bacterium]MDW8457296.1 isoprenoid biosynthesis glyoxalase ElbB [Cytophagaceae bacterium]
MTIAVLLSGCGVYDGSEIHEATFTLLAIDQAGAKALCIAPDRDQHHVINHLTGEEMNEKRNILIEAARIARGQIKNVEHFSAEEADALIIPGGFGAAKNLNQWALAGPDGKIFPEIKKIITDFVAAKKPVGGLCMGPTVIAKALEGSEIHATLTVGTTTQPSPYDIAAINSGLQKTGMFTELKTIDEICVDEHHKIVTAPCYMMEASISQVYNNTRLLVEKIIQLIGK